MALVLAQPEAQLNRKIIEHFAVMDSGVHPVQDGAAAKRQILLAAAGRKGLQVVADAWILPSEAVSAVLLEWINESI